MYYIRTSQQRRMKLRFFVTKIKLLNFHLIVTVITIPIFYFLWKFYSIGNTYVKKNYVVTFIVASCDRLVSTSGDNFEKNLV